MRNLRRDSDDFTSWIRGNSCQNSDFVFSHRTSASRPALHDRREDHGTRHPQQTQENPHVSCGRLAEIQYRDGNGGSFLPVLKLSGRYRFEELSSRAICRI